MDLGERNRGLPTKRTPIGVDSLDRCEWCLSPISSTNTLTEGCPEVIKSLRTCYNDLPMWTNRLHSACLFRQIDAVQHWITTTPTLINELDQHGLRPIQIAVIVGDIKITEVLLNVSSRTVTSFPIDKLSHVDRQFQSPSDRSLLQLAVQYGHESVVRLLLDNGSDPVQDCAIDECVMCFPLVVAAEHGHLDVVKLLSQVTPLNHRIGSAAVSAAASHSHVECLRYLLERGCPTFGHYSEDERRFTWTQILCQKGGKEGNAVDIMRLLFQHNTTLRGLELWDGWMLTSVCDFSVIERLLQAGFLETRHSAPFSADPAESIDGMLAEDLLAFVSYFEGKRKLCYEMRAVLEHFPVSLDIEKTANLLSHRSHDEIDCKRLYSESVGVSTLSRLCQWTIRREICKKNGLVTEQHIYKLGLPESLRRSLWFTRLHSH